MYFWDLVNFWGEIQTTSKSNLYGFSTLNGLLLDYFIKGCTVQKCALFEISHFFIILCDSQFFRWNSDHLQIEFQSNVAYKFVRRRVCTAKCLYGEKILTVKSLGTVYSLVLNSHFQLNRLISVSQAWCVMNLKRIRRCKVLFCYLNLRDFILACLNTDRIYY